MEAGKRLNANARAYPAANQRPPTPRLPELPSARLKFGAGVLSPTNAAYHTHRGEQGLLERGIEANLMRRGNKHHALSQADKDSNEAISKHRAPVEQVFGRMKTTYRWTLPRPQRRRPVRRPDRVPS